MHFVMRAPDALCAAPDEHVPVPNGRCPRVRARLVVAGSPAAQVALRLAWDARCVSCMSGICLVCARCAIRGLAPRPVCKLMGTHRGRVDTRHATRVNSSLMRDTGRKKQGTLLSTTTLIRSLLGRTAFTAGV